MCWHQQGSKIYKRKDLGHESINVFKGLYLPLTISMGVYSVLEKYLVCLTTEGDVRMFYTTNMDILTLWFVKSSPPTTPLMNWWLFACSNTHPESEREMKNTTGPRNCNAAVCVWCKQNLSHSSHFVYYI